MARRRSQSDISLPWENRGNVLGRLLGGARSRVVVALVAVVAGVFFLARTAERRNAERETRLAIVEVTQAVQRFRSEHGRCPRSIDELLHPPLSGRRYLRDLPRDGWGNPLLVRCPSQNDPDDVDVLAAGPSGSFFDDEIPR